MNAEHRFRTASWWCERRQRPINSSSPLAGAIFGGTMSETVNLERGDDRCGCCFRVAFRDTGMVPVGSSLSSVRRRSVL